MSCAQICGLHFVNVLLDKREEIPFARHLPNIQLHSLPEKNLSKAKENVIRNCAVRDAWPWKDIHSALYRNMDRNSAIFHNATLLFLADQYPLTSNRTIPKEDFAHISPPPHSNSTVTSHYPLIPDVAVHVRCTDIIYYTPDRDDYGFMHWSEYRKHIPLRAKIIYILSEPLRYGGSRHDQPERCKILMDSLTNYLQTHFPHATVNLIRGAAMTGLLILSLAETVFCPPSTFCTWSSVGRDHGTVYMLPNRLFPFEKLSNFSSYENHHIHILHDSPIYQFGPQTIEKDKKEFVYEMIHTLTEE